MLSAFFCNRELEDAHSAEADTVATYDVLKAMLEKYQNQEYEDNLGNKSKPVVNDMEALHRFSQHHRNADLAGQIIFDAENQEVFNFGKHKGRLVEEVFTNEPAYYDWMMRGSFPLYTKKTHHCHQAAPFGQERENVTQNLKIFPQVTHINTKKNLRRLARSAGDKNQGGFPADDTDEHRKEICENQRDHREIKRFSRR